MRFNPIARELVCKVVYYGPGLAGKTTNMQVVHDRVPPQQVTELVSVDTHSERTLHFDWLALDVGQVQGVNVRFEIFTVPGQNYYAATRRQVLQGADGVVFIADSRREALDENIDSMNEMLNNLRHHGLPEDLPVVMQYNKQDLPSALRREQLEPLMNVRAWPSFAATATAGDGVMETAHAISSLVAERATRLGSPVPSDVAQQSQQPVPGQSWLISCYRCQTILEVPNANIGSVYTCGVCGSTLEVTDTERGLTRAPSASQDDSGGYALQSASQSPDAGTSALSGSRTQPIERQVALADGPGFDLEGYDVVATLDESVQGRRVRVRERATGRTLRAFTVSPQLMRQPGYRDNLEPYVRMAGPIKHPNALPLANLRPTHDSAVLLSIDPPDHEPLAHVLARRRALAPPHAMGLLRQLALALEEAARHGVVHGWLRPDVVLVSPDGNALLDELCLPKNHRFLVRELSGASAATEYYLAPEHLGDDSRSDLRSDIFALGALLFRMITGEGLVTGYSAHEALHKVVANGPRPLRSTQAGVSRDLDLFYQRLVAAERKDRFQNYREVIDALDKFGGGAKRQTLRLTGTVANTGTGRAGRSTANAHIARRATGGSGNYAGRPRSGGGTGPATGSIRKKDDSGVVMAVVVVCVLLAVALIAVMVMNQSHSSGYTGQSQAESPKSKFDPPTVTRPISSPPAGFTGGTTTGATAGTSGTPRAAVTTATGGATGGGTGGEAPAPLTAAQRSDLLHQIADMRTEERYQAAIGLAAKFDSAEDRDALPKAILAQRDLRKKDIEAAVVNSVDLELIKKLVQPAQSTWGLPGDADWANKLVTTAAARIAAATPEVGPIGEVPKPVPVEVSPITGRPLAVQPAVVPPVTPPVATPNATPASTQPASPATTLSDPAAQSLILVDQALLAYAPIAAQQAITPLDAQSGEARALKHEIDWWNRRMPLLNRAAQSGKVKMRMPHPTTGEMWDVLGGDATNVDVSNPGGSKSTLPWTQFAPKDIAKVFQEAANLPDVTGEENATAAIMLMLAGDQTQASLQIRKAKPTIDADLGADLDTLMGLHRRRDLVDVLAKGSDALKSGNAKGIADALAELRKADKPTQAALASQIAKLDEAQQKLAVAKPATPAGTPAVTQGKDKVTFDGLDDLTAFPDTEGKWQVNGGAITNQVDASRLARHDLGNAKSVSLRFQTAVLKGTLTVEFRGAKVALDLAASTYTPSGKTAGRPKGFAIIPKLPYTLLLERKDDTRTTLQFNNGVESADISVGDLSDSLTITTDGGATVAIDEVEVFRDSKGSTMAEMRNALKVTGWEPIGGAYLQAPSIILPSSPGTSSGIATPLRDNVSGYNFEVKGTGVLRIQLGRLSDKDAKWLQLDVELPKNALEVMPLTVRWTDKGIAVYDAKGNEKVSAAIAERYTHLMILALNQATLVNAPKIEYKAP